MSETLTQAASARDRRSATDGHGCPGRMNGQSASHAAPVPQIVVTSPSVAIVMRAAAPVCRYQSPALEWTMHPVARCCDSNPAGRHETGCMTPVTFPDCNDCSNRQTLVPQTADTGYRYRRRMRSSGESGLTYARNARSITASTDSPRFAATSSARWARAASTSISDRAMLGGYQGCNTPRQGWCHDGTVPNQPKTPVRSFRIPDDIYLPAQEKARAEGESLTDVVRDALIEYVGDDEE